MRVEWYGMVWYGMVWYGMEWDMKCKFGRFRDMWEVSTVSSTLRESN